ncbi:MULTISPECIES: hypothetical protein [Bacillales]|uniref:hypothetical protein n=1 Tax=Bacillales TaxID=1385 RepID=UPI0006A7E67E|nr:MULTISPECIES: hypothetical protein [Bacillales]OBZ17821.1 hypothetical protein A7975_08260 [Bacillus sp. FJAT-26390]
MSRKEKFGSSRGTRQHEMTAEPYSIGTDSNEGEALPPRRRKHPSSINKVTKWYYNLLFLLFVCLVGGLFWYGLKFSE